MISAKVVQIAHWLSGMVTFIASRPVNPPTYQDDKEFDHEWMAYPPQIHRCPEINLLLKSTD